MRGRTVNVILHLLLGIKKVYFFFFFFFFDCFVSSYFFKLELKQWAWVRASSRLRGETGHPLSDTGNV